MLISYLYRKGKWLKQRFVRLSVGRHQLPVDGLSHQVSSNTRYLKLQLFLQHSSLFIGRSPIVPGNKKADEITVRPYIINKKNQCRYENMMSSLPAAAV